MIVVRCSRCRKGVPIQVYSEKFERWNAGEIGGLMQQVFPELTAAEREMFISGLCNDCWNEVTKPPDEEEDEEFLAWVEKLRRKADE